MEKYILIDYIYGIICSLIASIIFASLFYYFLRPNLRISKEIVERQEANDKRQYLFKIINSSYFANYNLNFELYLIQRVAIEANKYNIVQNKLSLSADTYKLLPGKKFREDNASPFTIIISTNEDLSSILKNKFNSLALIISSTHSITALSKIFEQQYSSIQSIKQGRFEFGNSLTIIESLPTT